MLSHTPSHTSFQRPLTHALTLPFIHSLTHPLTHARTHPLIHSLAHLFNTFSHTLVHILFMQVNAKLLFDILEVKALPNEYIEKLMDHLSSEFHEDGEHIYTVISAQYLLSTHSLTNTPANTPTLSHTLHHILSTHPLTNTPTHQSALYHTLYLHTLHQHTQYTLSTHPLTNTLSPSLSPYTPSITPTHQSTLSLSLSLSIHAQEDRCSAKIMVIESGFVNVHFSELLLRLDSSELLRMLGGSIARVRIPTSSSHTICRTPSNLPSNSPSNTPSCTL